MDGPVQIGQWQKISELGSGAFGVVTLWRDTSLSDYIAIKKCRFHTPTSLTAKQKERWKNEVDIMKLINHPNIVRFREIPPDFEKILQENNPSKLPLLSMEYCKKGNLRYVLQKPQNVSGLDEKEVRYILQDISSGLKHLHNLKITHRDIKPENIVLQHCDDRSTNTIYKIIDLGYAKELNDTVVSFVGTLHYLAPEIFEFIKYDSSVDYWSMGMVTFEIICGVLPFLPHLSPPQRFPEIKKKSPDDICIYLNYAGQTTNSTEIKKEHFISSCLKRDIETWLRHVLQFDPVARSQPFPNGVKVLDYLQDILGKNIVHIFSVHKLEFYSYEYDNSTLLGTLRDWISRDIKSSKNDIILLTGNESFCADDATLITNFLGDNHTIYVIRKSAFINYPLTYTIPKLIKEVMKSAAKFNMKYNSPLFVQSVYYLTNEKTISERFKTSLNLFNENLNHAVKILKKDIYASSKNLLRMVMKVDCFNSLRNNNTCDKNLSDNSDYKDYLIYNQRLLANLERCINSFQKLERKSELVMKRHRILKESWPDIEKVMTEYDLKKQYSSIIHLLESSEKGKNGEAFKKIITDAISQTVKIKEVTFKDPKVRAFISGMLSVLNCTESMLMWSKEFNQHIKQLSESFSKSEIMYRDILIQTSVKEKETAAEKSPSLSSLNGELQNLPTMYLIKENQEIRYKFEELLSRSILAHKKYVSVLNEVILS